MFLKMVLGQDRKLLRYTIINRQAREPVFLFNDFIIYVQCYFLINCKLVFTIEYLQYIIQMIITKSICIVR